MTRGGLGVGGSMLIVFLASSPRALSQTTVTVPVCAADVLDVVALEAFTRLEAGHDVRFTFDESLCRGTRVRVQIRDARGRGRFVTLTLPPGTRRARARALALSLAESLRGIHRRARPRVEASASEAAPSRSQTSSESSAETREESVAEIRAESNAETREESSAETRAASVAETRAESVTETRAESVTETSAESPVSSAATESRTEDAESRVEASPRTASGSSSSDSIESIGSAPPAPAPPAGASLDMGPPSQAPVDHPTPHGHSRERAGVSRRFGLDTFVRGTRSPSLLFGAGVELRWRRRTLVLVPHVAASFGSARRDVRARALLSEIGLSVGAAWTPGVELDLRVGPRVGLLGTWSTARGDTRVVPWLHLESELRVAFGAVVLRIALGALLLGARVYTPNTIAFDLRGLTFGVGIGLRMPR
jgi:hypothetical protein